MNIILILIVANKFDRIVYNVCNLLRFFHSFQVAGKECTFFGEDFPHVSEDILQGLGEVGFFNE